LTSSACMTWKRPIADVSATWISAGNKK
jgi:hypothetical protein